MDKDEGKDDDDDDDDGGFDMFSLATEENEEEAIEKATKATMKTSIADLKKAGNLLADEDSNMSLIDNWDDHEGYYVSCFFVIVVFIYNLYNKYICFIENRRFVQVKLSMEDTLFVEIMVKEYSVLFYFVLILNKKIGM